MVPQLSISLDAWSPFKEYKTNLKAVRGLKFVKVSKARTTLRCSEKRALFLLITVSLKVAIYAKRALLLPAAGKLKARRLAEKKLATDPNLQA